MKLSPAQRKALEVMSQDDLHVDRSHAEALGAPAAWSKSRMEPLDIRLTTLTALRKRGLVEFAGSKYETWGRTDTWRITDSGRRALEEG